MLRSAFHFPQRDRCKRPSPSLIALIEDSASQLSSYQRRGHGKQGEMFRACEGVSLPGRRRSTKEPLSTRTPQPPPMLPLQCKLHVGKQAAPPRLFRKRRAVSQRTRVSLASPPEIRPIRAFERSWGVFFGFDNVWHTVIAERCVRKVGDVGVGEGEVRKTETQVRPSSSPPSSSYPCANPVNGICIPCIPCCCCCCCLSCCCCCAFIWGLGNGGRPRLLRGERPGEPRGSWDEREGE